MMKFCLNNGEAWYNSVEKRLRSLALKTQDCLPLIHNKKMTMRSDNDVVVNSGTDRQRHKYCIK